MNGLRFEDVRLSLHGRQLLYLDTTIAPGEVLTVMGASGSGKSSLLAYAAGFLAPVFEASGEVYLNDEALTKRQPQDRHLGLLFQDPLLFPHMSVIENLLFALPRSAARNAAQRNQIAQEALSDAGLEGFDDRDPSTLSGGQQARVALMRVLISQPGALLLDEPFSKLDAKRRAQIRDFVFSEARKRNLPVLLVTHDPDDARAAAGRIIELDDGEAVD